MVLSDFFVVVMLENLAAPVATTKIEDVPVIAH
jgi:hypothetical protein